jgi:hypothetical protein
MVATLIWGFNAYNTFKSFYYMINNIMNYDEYRARIIAKLEKLGSNPDYLDKKESKE